MGFPAGLNAAEYPARPVQVVVPFPPGGGSDVTARFISDRLSALLGQPVLVVNKAGGGGVTGYYAAVAAPADGYTVTILGPTHVLAPLLTKGVTINLLKEFTLINMSVTCPGIICVKKDAPWRTLEELIAEVKKNPGKLTYSSSGYGSSAHFRGELFKMYTNTDITHVPLDGSAPSITAVMGGHIQIGFFEYGLMMKHLEAKSFRPLAVMAQKRLRDFPEIPTVVEKGFPKVILDTWQAFFVRSETPRPMIDKLAKSFSEVLKEKPIIDNFEKTGWFVENLGPAEGGEYLAKDRQLRTEVAKAGKIVAK
jgi:tripartite-type tricarboxylate transporter receptor subunit TctC